MNLLSKVCGGACLVRLWYDIISLVSWNKFKEVEGEIIRALRAEQKFPQHLGQNSIQCWNTALGTSNLPS